MTRLSELLNQEDKDSLATSSVKIGNVYLIKMDEQNDITPKDGDSYRLKYFIILGFNKEDNEYGGVVINSDINRHLPPYIQQLHIPIGCREYAFLRYDSYINCAQIKPVSGHTFDKWSFQGKIQQVHLNKIIATLQSNPMKNKAQLARYGL